MEIEIEPTTRGVYSSTLVPLLLCAFVTTLIDNIFFISGHGKQTAALSSAHCSSKLDRKCLTLGFFCLHGKKNEVAF